MLDVIFNNSQRSMVVLNCVIIPVMALLGGAYLPISDNINHVTGLFDILIKVSPIRWINLGITHYMTYGTYNELAMSLVINIVLIFIFITLLVVISKKREGKS